MQYVRLIKPEWFNHVRNEFGDLSFVKSTKDDSGMSIFELESLTVGIAAHVSEYYPDFLVNGRVIFSVLREHEFPSNYVLKSVDDPDPFHRGLDAIVEGGAFIKNKHFKAHFREKRASLNEFAICEADGSIRAIEPADIAEWARLKAQADES